MKRKYIDNRSELRKLGVGCSFFQPDDNVINLAIAVLIDLEILVFRHKVKFEPDTEQERLSIRLDDNYSLIFDVDFKNVSIAYQDYHCGKLVEDR